LSNSSSSSNPRVCIVYHEGIKDYDFGPEYELKGDRFPRYIKLLETQGILKREGIDIYTPEPATDEDLMLVHSKEYIKKVEKIAEEHGFLAEDTPLRPSIVKAVRLIVGAALKAGELVAENKVKIAQGVGGGLHHAGRDYGDGWCVFNDVAVVAQALLSRHGLDRVMIFDTDAHAGDGTIDIFYDEPKVLYLGVHQDPETLFPYTGFVDQIGKAGGEGYNVNIPLPIGADDSCMGMVLERVFKPLVRQFRPQVIIRNGGADPHFQDELADLNLSYAGLWMIGKATVEAANEVGCGLVDLVCSGYNPGFEEKGLFAILSGELGLELNYKEEEAQLDPVEGCMEKTDSTIKELSHILRNYWNIQ
jgi:acetoin utilization protein AcuC